MELLLGVADRGVLVAVLRDVFGGGLAEADELWIQIALVAGAERHGGVVAEQDGDVSPMLTTLQLRSFSMRMAWMVMLLPRAGRVIACDPIDRKPRAICQRVVASSAIDNCVTLPLAGITLRTNLSVIGGRQHVSRYRALNWLGFWLSPSSSL